MVKSKFLLVLLFSAAIVIHVNCQEVDIDTAEEEIDNSEDQNMPLSRHQRDLAVAETAGVGGGAGGAAGGKAGAAGGVAGGFKKGKSTMKSKMRVINSKSTTHDDQL